MLNNCPNPRRQINLVENVKNVDDAPEVKNDEEEYICRPDGEEHEQDYRAYVVKKLLLTPRCHDDSQCHKLFEIMHYFR